MNSTVGERLSAARRRRFVGRAREVAAFTDIVAAYDLPVAVLYVHGPAGVGKSTLLRRFADVCAEADIPVTALDARDLPPSPTGVAAALEQVQAVARSRTGRQVLLIDTYELLSFADAMLRDQLLPAMPADSLVVLAGQGAPGPGWVADPGWSELVRVMPLHNLAPEECVAFLASRNVPEEARDGAVAFTRGHPLALALVGEVLSHRGRFDPRGSPDVIRTLVDQLVQSVPSQAHRRALEAGAVVRVVTEPLLAALLGAEDASEVFGWLRRLPFVDSGASGLYLHDLTKDVLSADLEWRDPERFTELHARARDHYLAQLARADPDTQARVLLDLMFLHAELRPFLRPPDAIGTGGLTVRPAVPTDAGPVTEMVRTHEGEESALLAASYLATQLGAWQVVCDATDSPVGALCLLRLDEGSPDAAVSHPVVSGPTVSDPAVEAGRRQLRRQAPLRPGEVATLFRFWLARETYQRVSPVQSLIAVQLGRHYLNTPGLAVTLLPFADPDTWAAFAAYADQSRMPDADFTVGGRTYGVYGHDWRVVTPSAWLSALARREVGSHPDVGPSGGELLVLGRDEFAAAVREALRHATRPDRLRDSPLLRARVVTTRVPADAPLRERVAALQQVLLDATGQLRASPAQEDRRLHRILGRAYLQPAATLEKAAEALGLPSSTFRRHLKAAVERLVDLLWEQEVGR